MLEMLDLKGKSSIPSDEFKERKKNVAKDLFMLQKYLKGEKIPLILLFEGLEAAGKGRVIEFLAESLDPRGFRVFPILVADKKEKMKPFLYRFWIKTPAQGFIHIFDRSWYMHVLEERVMKRTSRKEWLKSYDEINQFERTLKDNGTYVIKFWLHISEKEQKKRLKKMENSKRHHWRVTKKEWHQHKKYSKYIHAAEDMFAATNTSESPWHLISTEDVDRGKLEVLEKMVSFMENIIGKAFREKALESFHKSMGIK